VKFVFSGKYQLYAAPQTIGFLFVYGQVVDVDYFLLCKAVIAIPAQFKIFLYFGLAVGTVFHGLLIF